MHLRFKKSTPKILFNYDLTQDLLKFEHFFISVFKNTIQLDLNFIHISDFVVNHTRSENVAQF